MPRTGTDKINDDIKELDCRLRVIRAALAVAVDLSAAIRAIRGLFFEALLARERQPRIARMNADTTTPLSPRTNTDDTDTLKINATSRGPSCFCCYGHATTKQR